VDLVQGAAFPDRPLSPTDATVTAARRWNTPISRQQFKLVTGLDDFPGFLQNDLKEGVLQVCANGEFTWRLRDVYAKATVVWDFQPPPGGNDTFQSILRGTRSRLVIRQGAEQVFKPVLYVEKTGDATDQALAAALPAAIGDLQAKYPGIGFKKEGDAWRVTIPDKYDVGHEAHFSQVTENYLKCLRDGRLPDWEVPNMLTKYATIMQAYELSR
jgi:hypothetical protein